MLNITLLDNAVFKIWDMLNKRFTHELWLLVTPDKYKQFEREFRDHIIKKWREYESLN